MQPTIQLLDQYERPRWGYSSLHKNSFFSTENEFNFVICCLWRRWSCHFYWILIWIEIQGVIKYCAERNCRRKKSIRTPSEVLGESVLSYQVVKNWSRDHKVGREFYEHTLDVRQRRTIVWFKKTLIWSTMSFSKMDESQWNSYQSAQLYKHS